MKLGQTSGNFRLTTSIFLKRSVFLYFFGTITPVEAQIKKFCSENVDTALHGFEAVAAIQDPVVQEFAGRLYCSREGGWGKEKEVSFLIQYCLEQVGIRRVSQIHYMYVLCPLS